VTARRVMWSAAAAVVAVAAVVLLVTAPWDAQETAEAPAVAVDWRDDALVATGERVYAEQCASCHGADLEGEPDWRVRGPDGLLPAPPHDETGHTWHHPAEQLFMLVKYGPAALAADDYQSAMTGYEGILTDEEIVAVLAYIKRQWPAEIRERHDQLEAASRP